MKGRGRAAGSTRRRGLTLGVALVAALAMPATATAAGALTVSKSNTISLSAKSPQADAAKKKKKKKKKAGRATTALGQSGLTTASTAQATAECTGKSHVTGGGFGVSPSFDQPTFSGLLTQNVISFPSGPKTWTVGGSAFNMPPAAGTLTAYARCESNSLGSVVSAPSISGTVAPATTTTALINCPTGTHVLGGGYSGTGPANLTNPATGTRTIILESRRTATSQWAVTAYTSSGSPVPASFTAYALCERNAKGARVSEATTVVPLGTNVRTVADASCAGRTHVVSGGFLIADDDPSSVPAVGIDENHPVGGKGWHLGMYEFSAALPAGSRLQPFAYCKNDSTGPKKKKKKKKK